MQASTCKALRILCKTGRVPMRFMPAADSTEVSVPKRKELSASNAPYSNSESKARGPGTATVEQSAEGTTHGIDASFLSKREPGDVTLKDVIPRSRQVLDWNIKGIAFSQYVEDLAKHSKNPKLFRKNLRSIVVILLFNGIDDIPAPVPCQEHNKCGRSRKRGKPEKTKSTVFWKRVDMFFAVWTDYDEATRWPRRLTSELLDEQLAEKDWQPAEPDREMAEDSQLAELALQLAEQGGVTDKDQVYQMIMETIREWQTDPPPRIAQIHSGWLLQLRLPAASDSAQPPAKRKKREG
eukprot:m51a1_g6303 hypothetical protein (295) ;mRNA; r:304512-305800